MHISEILKDTKYDLKVFTDKDIADLQRQIKKKK